MTSPYRTAPLSPPRRPLRWPWRVGAVTARVAAASCVIGTLTGLCALHGWRASVVCVAVVAACVVVRAGCEGRL